MTERRIYPEHVVDQIHEAPEEQRAAVHCVLLRSFISESGGEEAEEEEEEISEMNVSSEHLANLRIRYLT